MLRLAALVPLLAGAARACCAAGPGPTGVPGPGPGPAEGAGGRRLKIGIIGALGALVAVSNAAVLAVLASAVAGWSRSSRLTLLSLAAADAALALLVVPLNLLGGLAARPEPYCRAVAFLTGSLFGAALYSLAAVSLERYVAVCFPLRRARLLGRRRLALLLAAAWLGPALLLLPVALPGRAAVLRVRFSAAALLCEPDYASNAAYAGLLAAAIFCPSAAAVTFANLRLWQAARAQRRRARGAGPRPLRPRQLDAASRVLVPVVVGFYVCWAPCMATILYNGTSGASSRGSGASSVGPAAQLWDARTGTGWSPSVQPWRGGGAAAAAAASLPCRQTAPAAGLPPASCCPEKHRLACEPLLHLLDQLQAPKHSSGLW
ncbi:uncharacterized protein LOC142020728 isoform X2 [Carettochelys insculpta]|uniref:uncharacterized protein LOC142020728 isoform X2 n=1 Tax=Carettochelys insculpta TaxID=44489 RepID=UPI003EBDE1DC